jgi:hypothetical protein
MLPVAYATPAAILLLVGGLLSCFAGYRLFRVVLGLYGFVLGAAITSSMMGEVNTMALVAAAIVGGLLGALLIVAAYFVGVALIGAGLASIALHSGWQAIKHTDPPTAVLVLVAVLGALLALSVQRWGIIIGTAFAGSWTALLGGLQLADRLPPRAGATPAVWVLYPIEPASSRWWFWAAWIALALVGMIVQLSTSGKMGGAKKPRPPKKD